MGRGFERRLAEGRETMKDVRDMLYPGLASPAWGLQDPVMYVDVQRDVLVVCDGRRRLFEITAAEVADGSYKQLWWPRMRAAIEQRAKLKDAES